MTLSTTTRWTQDELAQVTAAEELQIASRRADGSLRPHVTIWVVRVDDGSTCGQPMAATIPGSDVHSPRARDGSAPAEFSVTSRSKSQTRRWIRPSTARFEASTGGLVPDSSVPWCRLKR